MKGFFFIYENASLHSAALFVHLICVYSKSQLYVTCMKVLSSCKVQIELAVYMQRSGNRYLSFYHCVIYSSLLLHLFKILFFNCVFKKKFSISIRGEIFSLKGFSLWKRTQCLQRWCNIPVIQTHTQCEEVGTWF